MQPALQEIVNRINQVNNILVTVKANPSVDELAAALGLTMALNNYGKHATAVFSGQIPNAMSFLKPQKTFENNVHSLRDFIISLNKEKADKLRFAKDGEIVKIYITPYKSTITPNDLAYSEGDFNVEMVIAIGINAKEELDTVIAAHGRILHEATVATVMAGPTPSQLGSINWFDATLSSASAMSVQLLQSLNTPNLISPEVATALLTGIVADTDRFSNAKTSPRVMELSAQLMNSGADHQLVTSSIGTVANPAISTTQAGNTAPIAAPISEPNQELVLDLHTPAAPNTTPPTAAINTSPMLSTPPEATYTPASMPVPNPQDTSQQLPPPPPNPLANTAPQTLSEPVAQLLPKPVDPTETVVPADLMPPTNASPQSITLEPTAPTIPAPETESSTPATPPAEDQIRSEIDKIYSAEPFDPANNPRQDLGTDVIIPAEENTEEIGTPAVSVDTSVQQNQANPTLKPIEATKNETISANDVLGTDPGPNTLPQVPGLEMPPEIKLPPPPPNPLAPSRTSSIDTEPFGNSINFDPTKQENNAT